MERTSVYRLFDASGRLLYVGVAKDPEKRFGQHARRPWWPAVVDRRIEWFEDRASAMRVESEAIRTENPVHNTCGTGGRHGALLAGPLPRSRNRFSNWEMINVETVRTTLTERLDMANRRDEFVHSVVTRHGHLTGALVGMEWYRRARAALGEPTDL